MSNKKAISVILCLLIAVLSFAGCSDKGKEEKTTAASTTTELATDTAKITGSQAINLLKSYSPKELGLEDIKEEYQYLLGTTGIIIDDVKYISAVAGAMVKSGEDEDGNDTYQMKSYGTFYIDYDGTKILVSKQDGKYDTIKISKEKLAAITTTTLPEQHNHDEGKSTTDSQTEE